MAVLDSQSIHVRPCQRQLAMASQRQHFGKFATSGAVTRARRKETRLARRHTRNRFGHNNTWPMLNFIVNLGRLIVALIHTS